MFNTFQQALGLYNMFQYFCNDCVLNKQYTDAHTVCNAESILLTPTALNTESSKLTTVHLKFSISG